MSKYAFLALLTLTACSEPNANTPIEPQAEMNATTTEAPQRLAVLAWSDLLSRDKPVPTQTLKIGERETDLIDVWLPETPGPHPVVIMVHGGCWQKSIADRTLMNYSAEDLRQRGMAVWNIEYRGVDENGGGYPGTYLDVAKATDALRDHADILDLDLSRVAGTGHSAGGHLVTWLAGRKNLDENSPLHSDNPIQMLGVLNVGGLADLELSERVTERACLGDIIDDLTGAPSEKRPDVFSDTSPAHLLPFGIEHVSLNGDLDRIAPVGLAHDFTLKARKAGDKAIAVIIAGNNHTDLIAPGTQAFERQAEHLARWLKVD